MAWSQQRALERIKRAAEEVTVSSVIVETLNEDYKTRELARRLERRQVLAGETGSLLMNLPRNTGIAVHGVQLYANLLNFDDFAFDADRTSARVQADALQFLHLHYQICDRIVAAHHARRVDFHGARLHSVTLEPLGIGNEAVRLRSAVRQAVAMRRLGALITEEGGRFRARFRFGIDSGPTIAINSGRRSEAEPLFLGVPANHAAKLAEPRGLVERRDEGIYMSNRARRLLGLTCPDPDGAEWRTPLTPQEEAAVLQLTTMPLLQEQARQLVVEAVDAEVRGTLEEWQRELAATGGKILNPAQFVFHRHSPPLSTIDFTELMPSKSIRMDLASIFADLDNFTAYVGQRIGEGREREVVRTIHVIREELAAVLKEDFGGRKVRFIGDCLHGLFAEGTTQSTDVEETATKMTLCAAGMHSSFQLCKSLLPDTGDLGLAIGFEFGWTPTTRMGLRGKHSVRCSASAATIASESEQSRCDGDETAIGEIAYGSASADVQRLFGSNRIRSGLRYPTVAIALAAPAAPVIVTRREEAPRPFRAHVRG